METLKVYQAISNVAKDLIEKGGIGKGKPEKEKGKPVPYGTPDYAFRSIDQVYNALSPSLVKYNLIILPRMIARQVTERVSSKGSVLFSVVVTGEFDFISTEDGSKVTISTFGEAMDSGDKATNKAMSVAYKYAAFQAFCIPTEETTQDADTETHEIKPTNKVDEPKKNVKGQPQQQAKFVLTPEHKGWAKAISSYKTHGNLDIVKQFAEVSPEVEQQIIDICENEKSQDDDIPL